MESLIAYLKQLKENEVNVVSVQFILDSLQAYAHQTAVKVPSRRFDKQEHSHIIQQGWRAYEANKRLRMYEGR